MLQSVNNVQVALVKATKDKLRVSNAVPVNSMLMLVWLHVNRARWGLQEKEVTLMQRNASNVHWDKQRRLKVRPRAVVVI